METTTVRAGQRKRQNNSDNSRDTKKAKMSTNVTPHSTANYQASGTNQQASNNNIDRSHLVNAAMPMAISEDILPVLDLLNKAENGTELGIKDVLKALVLVHSSFCTKLNTEVSRVLSQTETRITAVEDDIEHLKTDVTEQRTLLNARIEKVEHQLKTRYHHRTE